jgi:hypothetical protein
LLEEVVVDTQEEVVEVLEVTEQQQGYQFQLLHTPSK